MNKNFAPVIVPAGPGRMMVLDTFKPWAPEATPRYICTPVVAYSIRRDEYGDPDSCEPFVETTAGIVMSGGSHAWSPACDDGSCMVLSMQRSAK